jgi:putative phage-type endonuclease
MSWPFAPPGAFVVNISSDIPIVARRTATLDEEREGCHPLIQRVLDRPRIPSGSDEWARRRSTLLTGTNVASVVLPPHERAKWQKSRSAMLRYKRGGIASQSPPRQQNEVAMNHGLRYEDEAARIFTQVTGIELVSGDIGLITHPQYPFLGATPDRLCRWLPVIVEIKCPYRAAIHHAVPTYYVPQIQLQLELTDAEFCCFVQYRPEELSVPGTLDICVVPRDRSWFAKALPLLQAFWSEVCAPSSIGPAGVDDETHAITTPVRVLFPELDFLEPAATPAELPSTFPFVDLEADADAAEPH